MIFRRASETDLPDALRILREAARIMLSTGRHQWDENYPNEATLRADITRDNGYVITLDTGEIIAYAAIVFDGEPAYDRLCEGRWVTNSERYATIHRIAVDKNARGKGVASRLFSEVAALCPKQRASSIRIDTNYDNVEMLSLLGKLGFTYCGKVYYPRNDGQIERLAFELPVTPE